MNTDQLKDLKVRILALRGFFDYDNKKKELKDLELVSAQSEFWLDPKEAEKTMKIIKGKGFGLQAMKN